MHLDHIGVASADVEADLDRYRRLFGAVPYKVEDVASEGVRTWFLDAGGTKIELLEATTPDSAIARHIEKRGPGLHHLAFAVDSADEMFARVRNEGLRTLNDAPKLGADGKQIFFLHPKDAGGVLTEFCSPDPGAPRVPTSDGTRPEAD
ncbi:MAG: methylmalonyl-CoA epimerase [Bacteroidetes bacterium CG12_big_fil_rev_8_21_14_0_65_60_17]|nr:MAG: methylmalonyl-CoA epimerase [Bacteroidetes bacterium CG12_big_fil_rev_8_21_14_0_65_60_17]